MIQRPVCMVGFVALFLLSMAAEARDWAKIPQSEWDLKEVAGAPGASAVVLLDAGELHFEARSVSSYFEFYRRVKILNQEGRDHATVSVPSSDFHRMRDLEGRTHLPDGRVVPLGKDAQFVKKFDTFYKFSIHSFALPAVEVGAIIEYQYRLYFDSLLFAEPWFFQGAIPRLRSEITVEYPETIGFAPVPFSPYGIEIKEDSNRTPTGVRATYSMENVPPVPDEPLRFPFQDLSAWALFIPQEIATNNQVVDLLKDWQSTVGLMEKNGKYGYIPARKDSGAAQSKAKELAGKTKGPRERAQPIYEFVRDRVRTEGFPGVSVADRTADKTFKEARGSFADKALLLQAMLDGAKVDSTLCWIRPRDQGRTHQQLPTPFQFDQILVVLDVKGELTFLDPSDIDLPFGNLPPELEGVPCLLVDEKNPEWVTTPMRPAEANVRSAHLDVEVGEEGGLHGSGTLLLKGLHAWSGAKNAQSGDDPMEYWRTWLEERMDGFNISDVELVEDSESLSATIRWKLVSKETAVLGDEVSFRPSLPLGLSTNVFSLPPGRRRTPVLLQFADVDTVEVQLRWPEGWAVDAAPKLLTVQNGAGKLETSFEVMPEERKLLASRTLHVAQREFVGTGPYTHLHALFTQAAKNDAEAVILVRE